MKLTMVDFTHPATLKDRTDREIYRIIKNGHNDMPAEGPRITTSRARTWSTTSGHSQRRKKGTRNRNPRPNRNRQYFEGSKTLRLETPNP
jgi:hypothetical protein